MSLIPGPQIADVFLMWHIGFGNQQAVRPDLFQDRPPEFDYLMGLRQMNAAAVFLFPQETDGIESNCLGTA
ncbi:hypothetical protein SDC9_201989 [bioreactor metagenome]|uniref:Uncharacterized protein n=1 Tax=bioreactor metagenome TaxID=1076179 RepID=A0A645IV70_9ZZZZ